MNILKYKRLSNGKYNVVFDDMDLLVYEEVILKYNLLLKKNINEDELLKVKEDNNEWEIYYAGLKSLKSRFKSKNDLKKFLISKKYDSIIIDKVIDKLEQQGYIDDNSYCKSYINNQLITTNKGPNKIISELKMKGISDKDICMGSYSKEIQTDRINKLINKFIKSNKSRGGWVLKRKIINDLINLGYDSDLVNFTVDNYSFPVDEIIYKKEYDKLYRVLSKKYKDNELESKIKNKLYQKGLYYED